MPVRRSANSHRRTTAPGPKVSRIAAEVGAHRGRHRFLAHVPQPVVPGVGPVEDPPVKLHLLADRRARGRPGQVHADRHLPGWQPAALGQARRTWRRRARLPRPGSRDRAARCARARCRRSVTRSWRSSMVPATVSPSRLKASTLRPRPVTRAGSKPRSQKPSGIGTSTVGCPLRSSQPSLLRGRSTIGACGQVQPAAADVGQEQPRAVRARPVATTVADEFGRHAHLRLDGAAVAPGHARDRRAPQIEQQLAPLAGIAPGAAAQTHGQRAGVPTRGHEPLHAPGDPRRRAREVDRNHLTARRTLRRRQEAEQQESDGCHAAILTAATGPAPLSHNVRREPGLEALRPRRTCHWHL